jgi:hypothetical protein
MPETGQRILFGSFVGEESKLPRVECHEAWQRRRTVVFLLLCCAGVVGVDVVGFPLVM